MIRTVVPTTQEAGLLETTIPRLPDGLGSGLTTIRQTPTAPRPAKPVRRRSGAAGRLRLVNRVLDHLPMAVAVIDQRLRLPYWNLQAAELFNLPPVMQAEGPDLGQVLRDGGRIAPRQIERITEFCASVIQAKGPAEPAAWLRVSLSRQHRIACKLHGLGGGRWILGVEELHPASPQMAAGGDTMVDALTGLGNRRHFTDALRDVVRDAGTDTRHAVVLLDLDRFKTINDTLGLAVGDALLCLVAQRLRRETRDEDLVARLGGDEFAILQPNGDNAEALAARVVDILSRPFLVEGHVANVGASAGIARYPDHGGSADDLMRHADLALYGAKRGGGRTWRLFDPAMAEQATARRALESDLRRALALGQLSVAYQAQFDIRSRSLTGFEALMCWTHPARGAVPPAVFIPLAEDIGCSEELGEWMLKAACAEAARWPGPLTVAVNVSPRQFAAGDRLFDAVRSALHASGLPPGRLEIEITEATIMTQEAPVLGLLHRLRALGIRIAMDDFGTGCASLSQLRAFPFDTIKIDRSIVATPGSDNQAAAMIRAITALGTGLGMTTIADGVETDEQAAMAAAAGCNGVQGFLIGKPVQAAEIAALLHQYPAKARVA